ncbi:MAG: hypothetical protein MI757_22120 [Pirellulales bacterium]|nr:hypothetical protein [Pirellulales bacterium]
MDKLKPIFKIIQKYHIWVLCVLIIGTAVGALFASSGKLAKSAKATEGKVKGLDAKAQGLVNTPKPPNQSWLDAKDAQTAKEREHIASKWEKIYKNQQEELVWPEAAGGQAFADKIEQQMGLTRLDKIQEEQFEKYAAGVFDSMLEIVKAEPRYRTAPAAVDDKKKTPPPRGGAAKVKQPASGGLPPVRAGYVVGWTPASQKRIADPLLRWGNEIDFKAPTARRAKATQRDIWIYETLLKAIAAANADATANYMAKVKYIVDLRIGDDVSLAAAQPADGKAKGNDKGKAATQVRRAPRPPNKSAGIAESVPVRMDLIIDQRHLALLLAKCSNRKLPIEVTDFTARYTSRSRKDRSDRVGGEGAEKEAGVVGTVVDTYDMYVTILGKVHFYKESNPAMLGGPVAGP